MADLRIYPNPQLTAAACAAQIIEWLSDAIRVRGKATLAISGGSSPRAMFGIFAAAPLPWEKVHLFWVDERSVPPTSADSNFKLANDAWLSLAPVKPVIHRIAAELPPAEAAERYAVEIREFFATENGPLASAGLPSFDVIHRGMGPDSHTASLFPGESKIREYLLGDRSGIAAAVWVEKFRMWRVTLLPGVLEQARHTAMLVTGADKREALEAVLNGPTDPLSHPAQIAASSAVWFADAAAAGGA
jgi:6-phosphogluconolactonase